MKKIPRSAWVLCTAQMLFSSSLVAQSLVPQDSVPSSDTLYIKPNLQTSSALALGNFLAAPHDRIAFQTYAGSNILNTLRGHLPNFYPGGNFSNPSGSALVVIDGLPYQNSISSYYNLNSFEYQDAYAVRSGNAVALYGGAASGGSIFLRSKTGENIDKPTFEFNTSPTASWAEYAGFNGASETITQWILTNKSGLSAGFRRC